MNEHWIYRQNFIHVIYKNFKTYFKILPPIIINGAKIYFYLRQKSYFRFILRRKKEICDLVKLLSK